MKAFEFSLQKLLDVKLAKEQACEQRLALAQRELDQQRAVLREWQQRLEQEVAIIEGFDGRKLTPREVIEHIRYMDQVQEQIRLQAEQILACEEKVNEVREELCRLLQERKGLDKLSEREYLRWLKEVRRQEQRLTDEAAVTGHCRRQVEAPAYS
jgi:flagellar FliJ protein